MDHRAHGSAQHIGNSAVASDLCKRLAFTLSAQDEIMFTVSESSCSYVVLFSPTCVTSTGKGSGDEVGGSVRFLDLFVA